MTWYTRTTVSTIIRVESIRVYWRFWPWPRRYKEVTLFGADIKEFGGRATMNEGDTLELTLNVSATKDATGFRNH